MKISSAYPSKYLKAADINGGEFNLIIDRVVFEKIDPKDPDPKPVVYFQGAKKGMVLNKTNAQRISNNYGDETNDWQGCAVVLFEDQVNYQGQQVPALRVRIPRGRPMRQAQAPQNYEQESEDPAPAGARQSEQGQGFQRSMDDEIPF